MRPKLAMAVLTASIALLGCAADGDDDDAGDASASRSLFKTTVKISQSRYRPARARVLVGGSVTWVNWDRSAPHTAETLDASYRDMSGGEDQSFDTHTLSWGEPYTVTFHKPGTYTYFCSFDPRMRGEVEVTVMRPPR